MSAPKLTFGNTTMTAAEARAAGKSFEDIVRAAFKFARTDADVDRRMRLFLADCIARVLPIYEDKEPFQAPREAIIAARQYARDEIDISDLKAARAAALAARDATGWAAAWDVADAAAYVTYAAADVARAAALAVVRATRATRAAAARDAHARAGPSEAAEAERIARAAEEQRQFDGLIDWLSETEPADWPLPAPPKRRAA